MDLIEKVHFETVKVIITHELFHEIKHHSSCFAVFRGKLVVTFQILPEKSTGDIFEFTVHGAVVADKIRCDPEHVFQTETLDLFHMFFEVGELGGIHLPVADLFVPCGDGGGADPFHVGVAPSVIKDKGFESQIRRLSGDVCAPFLGHGAVDGIPGTEDRFPDVTGIFTADTAEVFTPQGNLILPGTLRNIEPELEVGNSFRSRELPGDVVAPCFLIHLA